jgi:hypothetical protein
MLELPSWHVLWEWRTLMHELLCRHVLELSRCNIVLNVSELSCREIFGVPWFAARPCVPCVPRWHALLRWGIFMHQLCFWEVFDGHRGILRRHMLAVCCGFVLEVIRHNDVLVVPVWSLLHGTSSQINRCV